MCNGIASLLESPCVETPMMREALLCVCRTFINGNLWLFTSHQAIVTITKYTITIRSLHLLIGVDEYHTWWYRFTCSYLHHHSRDPLSRQHPLYPLLILHNLSQHTLGVHLQPDHQQGVCLNLTLALVRNTDGLNLVLMHVDISSCVYLFTVMINFIMNLNAKI